MELQLNSRKEEDVFSRLLEKKDVLFALSAAARDW
jgi:hypothetical protein